jgi:glycosyltransferase involved in cell wall biosynthesis
MTLRISVVAPAYNEAACIEEFVAETSQAMEWLGVPYELVCVDDASSDATPEVLGALRAAFPALRVLRLDAHHGQSAALWAGIRAARGEVIALMDSDLQNDPGDIGTLVAALGRGTDCVVGVRRIRRDSWIRRWSSRIANWMGRRITGHAVTDAGCGLKVCRSELLRRVPFFRGAHRFISCLVAAEGGRVLELPVNHRPRPRGRSKYGHGLGRTLVALADALGVRWMERRKLRFAVREAAAPGEVAAAEERKRWMAGS